MKEEKKVGKQKIKSPSFLWPTIPAGLPTHLAHLIQTARPQSRRGSCRPVWLVTAYITGFA
jgi:hypothetical protein